MIRNKDGTIYKISSPNSLISEQDIWSDKFILHNKIGKKVVYDQELNLIEEKKEENQKFLIEKKVIKKEMDIKEEKSKVSIWCLPVFYEESVDPLYGDRYSKKKYGDKFMFEGIIENITDFLIFIWTDIEIPIGSVIFPRNYDKRWWEVKEKKENILMGQITDFQPYFS